MFNTPKIITKIRPRVVSIFMSIDYLWTMKKYFIICNKGFLSKKAVSMLEYFGYDVTQVIH